MMDLSIILHAHLWATLFLSIEQHVCACIGQQIFFVRSACSGPPLCARKGATKDLSCVLMMFLVFGFITSGCLNMWSLSRRVYGKAFAMQPLVCSWCRSQHANDLKTLQSLNNFIFWWDRCREHICITIAKLHWGAQIFLSWLCGRFGHYNLVFLTSLSPALLSLSLSLSSVIDFSVTICCFSISITARLLTCLFGSVFPNIYTMLSVVIYESLLKDLGKQLLTTSIMQYGSRGSSSSCLCHSTGYWDPSSWFHFHWSLMKSRRSMIIEYIYRSKYLHQINNYLGD